MEVSNGRRIFLNVQSFRIMGFIVKLLEGH